MPQLPKLVTPVRFRSPAPFFLPFSGTNELQRRLTVKYGVLFLTLLSLMISGCATKRLPSEDIEAPRLYASLIETLKDPRIPTNSKVKYDAIRALMKKVDFTFTRETKTINEFLAPGDAIIDLPDAVDRRITFNYQYQNKFVRLVFFTYRNFVVRVDIIEK